MFCFLLRGREGNVNVLAVGQASWTVKTKAALLFLSQIMSDNPFESSSKMICPFQRLLKSEGVLGKTLNKHHLRAYCMPGSGRGRSQTLHLVSAGKIETGHMLRQKGMSDCWESGEPRSALPGIGELSGQLAQNFSSLKEAENHVGCLLKT